VLFTLLVAATGRPVQAVTVVPSSDILIVPSEQIRKQLGLSNAAASPLPALAVFINVLNDTEAAVPVTCITQVGIHCIICIYYGIKIIMQS
jgi:hypothetical protein